MKILRIALSVLVLVGAAVVMSHQAHAEGDPQSFDSAIDAQFGNGQGTGR